MLTELYIDALLVNEELADRVWEAWDAGEIDDQIACIAWLMIAESISAAYRDMTSRTWFIATIAAVSTGRHD